MVNSGKPDEKAVHQTDTIFDEIRAMLIEFGEASGRDMTACRIRGLKHLRQTGKLEDYINSFEQLHRKVEVGEEQVISWFVDGLNSETQRTVRLFEPRTLHEAYVWARLKDADIVRKEAEKIESSAREYANKDYQSEHPTEIKDNGCVSATEDNNTQVDDVDQDKEATQESEKENESDVNSYVAAKDDDGSELPTPKELHVCNCFVPDDFFPHVAQSALEATFLNPVICKSGGNGKKAIWLSTAYGSNGQMTNMELNEEVEKSNIAAVLWKCSEHTQIFICSSNSSLTEASWQFLYDLRFRFPD